jgi:hypothetical protein
MLDIKGNSLFREAARLSNFTNRPFIFDSVQCTGLEGILQALKCPDPSVQANLCSCNGKEAQRLGQEFNNWKIDQMLWWKERPYGRSTREYMCLISDLSDSVFEQDPTFREDLLRIGYRAIYHSIGNPDMRDTVLTEVEMLYQLNRLRIRALTIEPS